MSVSGMNHFTILTDDVTRTVRSTATSSASPRSAAPLGFPGAWLYAGDAGRPARRRRPTAERAQAGRHRPHGVLGAGAARRARDARRVRHRARVPAAGRLGCVAGVLPRSQRRAGRARLRAGRIGAAMTPARCRRRRSTTWSSPRRRSPTASSTSRRSPASTPQPGGKHVAMGTHNALLRLGRPTLPRDHRDRSRGPEPSRPRWFDLDDIALQAELDRAAAAHPLGRAHDRHRATRRARARSRSAPCTRCRAATIAGASRFPTTARCPAGASCRR